MTNQELEIICQHERGFNHVGGGRWECAEGCGESKDAARELPELSDAEIEEGESADAEGWEYGDLAAEMLATGVEAEDDSALPARQYVVLANGVKGEWLRIYSPLVISVLRPWGVEDCECEGGQLSESDFAAGAVAGQCSRCLGWFNTLVVQVPEVAESWVGQGRECRHCGQFVWAAVFCPFCDGRLNPASEKVRLTAGIDVGCVVTVAAYLADKAAGVLGPWAPVEGLDRTWAGD